MSTRVSRLIALALIVATLFAPVNAGAQGPCSVFRTWATGDSLTAGDLNSSFTTAVATNMVFSCLNDYSATNAQMQTTTDPYPSGAESLATTGQGELERLRFVLRNLKRQVDNVGVTQWYIPTNRLTNKSGAGVVAGDVVVIGTTTASSFTTTTTSSYTGKIGVAIATIANDAVGEVAFIGIQTVKVNGATTIGRWLRTHTVATEAIDTTTLSSAAAPAGAFAIALTSSAGAGTVSAYLLGSTAGATAAAPTIQVFTANGTYTKPAGLTAALVITTGGGGGGGAANVATAGGGGGGGTAIELLAASAIGATETVTIGASASGGGAGTNNAGTAGNTSSFGALNSATGGAGGGGGTGGTGGNGGSGAGGSLNFDGGDGETGSATSGVGGGGGSSFLGGEARNDTRPGHNYGGGGGAGFNGAGGGAGAGGALIVIEFY